MSNTPRNWLQKQQALHRVVLLMIDRLAEPDPLIQLFQDDAVHEYASLYQDSEVADMAELGPWLVRPNSTDAAAKLLENPQLNWGWLASVEKADMPALAEHWRNRIVVHENGQRSLYRFQDNRVIARHLQALHTEQWPLLLGPINSALAWDGERWQAFDNPAPALLPIPVQTPWLELVEPEATGRAIRRHNLQLWLWQQHTSATASLAEKQPLEIWLDERLVLAERWGWRRSEQLQFLLSNQLQEASARHPDWQPAPEETAEEHFNRCLRAFSAGAVT